MSFGQFLPPYYVLCCGRGKRKNISVWSLGANVASEVANITAVAHQSVAFDGERIATLHYSEVAVYDRFGKRLTRLLIDRETEWAQIALLRNKVVVLDSCCVRLYALDSKSVITIRHGLNILGEVRAYSTADAAVFVAQDVCCVVDFQERLLVVPGKLASLSPVLVAQKDGNSIRVVDTSQAVVLEGEIYHPDTEIAVGGVVVTSQPWTLPQKRPGDLVVIWHGNPLSPVVIGIEKNIGEIWAVGNCAYAARMSPLASSMGITVWDVSRGEMAKYYLGSRQPVPPTKERLERNKDLNTALLSACARAKAGETKIYSPQSPLWLSALASPSESYLQWGKMVGFAFPSLPRIRIVR